MWLYLCRAEIVHRCSVCARPGLIPGGGPQGARTPPQPRDLLYPPAFRRHRVHLLELDRITDCEVFEVERTDQVRAAEEKIQLHGVIADEPVCRVQLPDSTRHDDASTRVAGGAHCTRGADPDRASS